MRVPGGALRGSIFGLCAVILFVCPPQKIDVPSVSAIQSFSFNGEAAKTTGEREVMVNTMFYAVGLACGLGPLYTFDMHSRQNMMDTSSDLRSSSSSSEDVRLQTNFFGLVPPPQPIPPQNIFPGTSFKTPRHLWGVHHSPS